jgi:Flagellar motor component
MDQCQTDELKEICQETISAIEKRHQTAIFFFEQMGKYAPGFGLLGTVVGLIQLLSTLDSPDQLGQGMALALVTTFYGILLANLLFQPIAGRLYALSHYEQRHNEMLMIGILELANGSSALLIKEKMMMVVNNQRASQ